MQLADFLDVQFGGVDAARGRPIDVPKGSLLCVEYLALVLIPLFVDLGLSLSLHEYVLPLSAKHLL